MAHSRTPTALPLALVLLAAAAVGCVSDMDLSSADGSAFACLSNSDCLSGFVCEMRGDPYGYGVCVRGSDASVIDVPDASDGDTDLDADVSGPLCSDGTKNGDESDTDCGGSCTACDPGSDCNSNLDCSTGYCDDAFVCQPALIGMACETSRACATGFCGPLPDGTNVCGEPCSGGDGCGTAGYICAGNVCVPSDLCVEQRPGVWAGPACDCSTHCDPIATCTQTEGSVSCECPMGFEPSDAACKNVDECTTILPCDENATCTDTDGSYMCDCNFPWEGDGQTCNCTPVTIEAGADQDLYLAGTLTTTLAATPVLAHETGIWLVEETFPAGKEATAVFGDTASPTSTFSGNPGVVYRLIWEIDNGCSENIARVSINIDPCYGERETTDSRDGKVYPIAPIMGRCWMTDYMQVGQMLTADNPVEVPQTDNGVIEKYCYGDDPAGCDTWGGSYTWDEATQWGANGDQGICPTGYKLPNIAEFDSLGATSAYELLNPAEHAMAMDIHNWNGRMPGRHDNGGSFCCRQQYGYHWTPDCPGHPSCIAWKMYDHGAIDSPYMLTHHYAVAVRCIKSP